MRIALIACCKKKLGKDNPSQKFRASDIYIGHSFTLSKNIGVKMYDCDDYYIISAQHHLLDKNDLISYYDKTLNKMGVKERKEWANVVLKQLSLKFNLEKDEFLIFGGGKYYEFLKQHLNCTVFKYANSNCILLDKSYSHVNNGGK